MLLAFPLLAVSLGAMPSRAAPTPMPAPSAPSAMKMALKICRMPGSGEIPAGKAIRIPRGAVYDEGELGAAFGVGSAGPSPKPIRLATAAPAAIAANAFCAVVPVTPIGKPGAAALRASRGTMFTPGRYWTGVSGFGALNLTYGYWVPGQG